MGAIEDLGFHREPLARAIPEAPPEPEVGGEGHVVDELIDSEISEWSHEQEDQRKRAELLPNLRQMLGPTASDPYLSERIINRLADAMMANGVNPFDENSVKHMVLTFAQNAEPLGLGRIHPVLRAYAYAQTLKQKGKR